MQQNKFILLVATFLFCASCQGAGDQKRYERPIEQEEVVTVVSDQSTIEISGKEDMDSVTETEIISKPSVEVVDSDPIAKPTTSVVDKPSVKPPIKIKDPEVQVEAPVLVVPPAPNTVDEPTIEELEMEIDPKEVGHSILEDPIDEMSPPDHMKWETLLQTFVDGNGRVNYGGFKKSEGELDKYLRSLEENYPQSSWSKGEQLAYWINAYNAYTIKLILNQYPVKSILDIDNGKAWDRKWIELDGKKLSLNNIENDIIRKRFNEPRIHFAVNCAAVSCPPIVNRAFTASNLESLLQERTVRFINDQNHNKISDGKAQVSKIFEWYGEDFGDLVSYLNKYSKTKIEEEAKITFMEYNWALNQ